MGGVTREDQGWGECVSVTDRIVMIAGLLQKVKEILTGNKFEEENAAVSDVRHKVTILECAVID